MTFDVLHSLGCVAYELYRAQLIGNAPPNMIRRMERMNDPRVGDLVLETVADIWVLGEI